MSETMRFGVTTFVTDRTISPVELAAEAEARGFASIFFPEHSHIPVSRRTPAPGGEPLGESYSRALDPFVALGAASAATSRIRLGTGVCIVAQRDPIQLAKAVATLDHISGGRVVLGIGFGWNAEEMEHHGVDFRHRREITREKVLAMRRLWSDDEAGFEGRYVRFEPSWMWPKPVRRGGPPVLIGGGAGPRLFAHVAGYGDGWMPVGGRGIASALPPLHAACEAAGRDPGTVEVVPFGSIPTEGKIEHFIRLGIRETVLAVREGDRDAVLRVLDRYATIVAPFTG